MEYMYKEREKRKKNLSLVKLDKPKKGGGG